jgi:DNA replication protein DnaC
MARPDHPPPTQLDRDLVELKLLEIAQGYRAVLDEAARKGSSMLEVLATLIGMEQTVRQQRALERRLRQARLPKRKTLAEYDFDFPKRIPKTAIVRLFDCDFIPRHGCAVLIGPTGTGKTHLTTALGLAACRQGKRVRFFTAAGLVTQLEKAQQQHRLDHLLGQLNRADLLICDELGYLSFSRTGAELLFQVFADRYERRSLLITSNLAFGEWSQVFQGERMTAALLDRLTHRCHIFEMNGESYRFRESMKAKKDKDPKKGK